LDMDTSLLEKIGLTPGEIKAYLALLKLGSSSSGPLAKESGVSRSKLYSILDKLEKKGLASHIDKRGVIYFQAVEPAKVKDYIHEKEDELKRLEEEFDELLPRLEAYQKQPGAMQNVTIYQGMKGLQAAHEHTYLKLKRGEEYVYMGIPKYQPEAHHRYWNKDHQRRVSLGIRTRLLFNRDTPKEVLDNRNSYKGCDARYMAKDTVMMAIPSKNPITIEMVSQEIADAFMAYFEEFWKRTKKFKKGD